MKKLNVYSSLTLIVILFYSGCHQETDVPVSDINPIEIDNLQLFIDFEQHGLLMPWKIEYLQNGRIAVLDNQQNKVLIIDKDGELINSFGREGRGPGEFIRPNYLQISEDNLYVIDEELLRVNQFNLSGEFVQNFNIDSRQGVAMMDEEIYFEMAMGEKGSLIRHINIKENSTHYFGDAMGDVNQSIDFYRETSLLRRGEIPDYFKNSVTMYYRHPYLYIFLDAFSRLQKYSYDGQLIWDQAIDLPVNEIIFNHVVERARGPVPPGAVPAYQYITSMKTVNDQAYLFWFPVEDHPRSLIKIDKDGNLEAIYHIPEEVPTFSDFSIDLENNFLYLISPELGQIYRTRYPQ